MSDKPPKGQVVHARSDMVFTEKVCDACKKTVKITASCMKIKSIPNIQGVTDHGFECPKCKTFFHSCYSNPDLDALRYQVSMSRGVLRMARVEKYNSQFVAFQVKMKKTLDDLRTLAGQAADSKARQEREEEAQRFGRASGFPEFPQQESNNAGDIQS